MGNNTLETGEIVVYQPDEVTRLEVKVEEDTVWLTQAQMAILFDTTPQNVTIHIKNLYKENELDIRSTCKDYLQVQKEGGRLVRRTQKIYCLDVIISVGYRVKSIRGTRFRQWANSILKEYVMRGALNASRRSDEHTYICNEIQRHAEILSEHNKTLSRHTAQIEFFVRTSLPPVEGVFYDGQIFDAYVFVVDLIKSAKCRIVLIDNYVDESVLMMLSKRASGVSAEIRTGRLTKGLELDIRKHNSQYTPVNVVSVKNIHDRFLIVDDTVYHIGASLKDLGKKLFAFSKITIPYQMLLR